MNGFMATALVYMALGVLAFIFSHEIAAEMNRLSLRLNEVFPGLKKIPLSHLAGSQLNYKTSLYFFRTIGVLMVISGAVLLGLVILH